MRRFQAMVAPFESELYKGSIPHATQKWNFDSNCWRRLCCLGVTSMLWTIFAILLILWLLGWGFHIAGSLIHLLLVVAVIVLIINLVTGRRAV